MQFTTNAIMRLVKKTNITTKSGKPMTFVTLGDTGTFENQQFALNREANPASYTPGQDYRVALNYNDKYVDVELVPASPSK
jgi:hypothetical protein